MADKATKTDNRRSKPAGGRTLHRFGGSLAKERGNGNPMKPVVPAQTPGNTEAENHVTRCHTM